eukprot:4093135-Amphidinium_carterae.1
MFPVDSGKGTKSSLCWVPCALHICQELQWRGCWQKSISFLGGKEMLDNASRQKGLNIAPH